MELGEYGSSLSMRCGVGKADSEREDNHRKGGKKSKSLVASKSGDHR